jgi:5S rRNA maturation endonuclease (ribonuclease M5)
MNEDIFLLKLSKFIESLNYESSLGSVVVVEGKRDLGALRFLGYTGNALVLNSFRGIIRFADFILEHFNRVIILFDTDRKGKVLSSRMLDILPANYLNKSLYYIHQLTKITKGKIKHIEDLYMFGPKLREIETHSS